MKAHDKGLLEFPVFREIPHFWVFAAAVWSFKLNREVDGKSDVWRTAIVVVFKARTLPKLLLVAGNCVIPHHEGNALRTAQRKQKTMNSQDLQTVTVVSNKAHTRNCQSRSYSLRLRDGLQTRVFSRLLAG